MNIRINNVIITCFIVITGAVNYQAQYDSEQY